MIDDKPLTQKDFDALWRIKGHEFDDEGFNDLVRDIGLKTFNGFFPHSPPIQGYSILALCLLCDDVFEKQDFSNPSSYAGRLIRSLKDPEMFKAQVLSLFELLTEISQLNAEDAIDDLSKITREDAPVGLRSIDNVEFNQNASPASDMEAAWYLVRDYSIAIRSLRFLEALRVNFDLPPTGADFDLLPANLAALYKPQLDQIKADPSLSEPPFN